MVPCLGRMNSSTEAVAAHLVSKSLGGEEVSYIFGVEDLNLADGDIGMSS